MKYFFFFFFFFHLSYAKKDSIVDVGQNLIYENKLDDAISYFNLHLKESKNNIQKTHILLGLAEVFKLKMEYDVANKYYNKVYDIIKKDKNIQLEFLYDVKMAEFYRKRGLFKEYSIFLEKAKKILKKNPIDDAILTKYYSRKAAIFTEYFKTPDSTIFYAQKSLRLAKKLNDKDVFFYASLEISGVYKEKKEYLNAIQYLEELIKFSKSNNFIQQQVDAYINYTRVLIKDKQYDKALNESLLALDFAKKNNLFYGEILFTDNIRNIYESLGNTTKAYEYLKIRLELTDLYYKKEHSKFLFELEEKYKLTEKENQIKIINLEIDNKNKTLASNKTQLYIILGLLLCVVLIAMLIAYYLRKSRSTNKQLQFLSDQNEFLLSEANHRINNNLQLIIILISDQISKLPENKSKEIENILKKINSIATLHRHLYQSNDKKTVNSLTYLKDIKNSFSDLFSENNIKTNFNVEAIDLPIDMAMYLGLLLTELCVNSIKHAFINQEYKEINFELKKSNDSLSFKYSDNGSVLSDAAIKPKLIDKLCRQLRIEYTINTEKSFNFSFEKKIN